MSLYFRAMYRGESAPSWTRLDIEEAVSEIERELERGAIRRIELSDFLGSGLFHDDEINSDLKEVERLKRIFKEKNKTQSRESREIQLKGSVAEYVLFEHIRNGSWMGRETKIILTSHYDDYKNGVDAVLQFLREGKGGIHVGLAVDFTLSGHEAARKVEEILRSIEADKVSKVKYFSSDETGKLKNFDLPLVIVGADHKAVARVSDLYLNREKEENQKALERDPLQFVLLLELRTELSLLKGFAEQNGKKNIANIYSEALQNVERTIKERGITEKELTLSSRTDSVLRYIIKALSRVYKG